MQTQELHIYKCLCVNSSVLLMSNNFLTVLWLPMSILILPHKDLFQCFITLQVLHLTKLDVKISAFWYFCFLISFGIIAVFSITLDSRTLVNVLSVPILFQYNSFLHPNLHFMHYFDCNTKMKVSIHTENPHSF